MRELKTRPQRSEVTKTCLRDPDHDLIMIWIMIWSWSDHEIMIRSWCRSLVRSRGDHNFFVVSTEKFSFGFQEHGHQGYLHDFGREKNLNPTWIPSRLKQLIQHFREIKPFFPQQFNSKTVSIHFWLNVWVYHWRLYCWKLRSKVLSLFFMNQYSEG